MNKLMSFLIFLFIAGILDLSAQKFVANYEESKIPHYTLPDPLVFDNGDRVKNKNDWARRRAEIYKIFENEVYGVTPQWNGKMITNELSFNENALNGTAICREVELIIKNGARELPLKLLLYLPKSSGKVPVFLGYNFSGNHTVTDEKNIALASIWKRAISDAPVIASESERGRDESSWQVREIVKRGYGLATIYYCDADPDFDDGFKNGIHGLFGQQADDKSWGSLAAWAWGLSRALDYLETVSSVDAKKVIVFGHSRLGKAALWAGASDKRFAMAISNNSGCGGAALSKRIFGETVGSINRQFTHWFCDNFNKYNEKEEMLPVDQHQLLSLIAPRPVYVASAEDDKWADPKGEFLSCVAASPVYFMLGGKGFPASTMPVVNSPVIGSIGYHIRTGGHDVTLYDYYPF